MKACILAGGRGIRLTEETATKPKPMVEIGNRPILWHIMKIYAKYGIREFVIALGYRGDVIKNYFLHYPYQMSDVLINLKSNKIINDSCTAEDWDVCLFDTGLDTMTGGRVKRLISKLGNEPFLLTYGDGVANINIEKLISFHREQKKLATMTVVRIPSRFGNVSLDYKQQSVREFQEKSQAHSGWINGGFFVFEPEIDQYIEGDETYLEREPLTRLAEDGQLAAYCHDGFWQCMDTVRDVEYLNDLWKTDKAGWKIW